MSPLLFKEACKEESAGALRAAPRGVTHGHGSPSVPTIQSGIRGAARRTAWRHPRLMDLPQRNRDFL